MGRDELLRRVKEKEEALKEISQKFRDPAGIIYDLQNEDGGKVGSLEYIPKDDKARLTCPGLYKGAAIEGNVLKSLRDVLNKLLDD